MRNHQIGLAVAIVLASNAFAGRARADDESDRVAADRLAAIVHDAAESDDHVRKAGIAGLLVGGAVAIGIGVPLIVDGASRPSPHTTNDDIELVSGIGLAAAGGALILFSPLALIRTPTERIDSRIRALSDKPPSERLAREESILKGAADEERSGRRANAVLSFVLAGVNAGLVPLEVAVNNQPIAWLSGFASVVGIVTGAIQLAAPGPLERLWTVWRIGTGRAATSIRVVPVVSPSSAGVLATF